MQRTHDKSEGNQPRISRRGLLVGAAVAGGLVVGWSLWPRTYVPNLTAAPGEFILSGYVKVGADGHVTLVAPQAEMGQGNLTLIAQIIAEELGADWRTIGIEPAPVNLHYANPTLSALFKGKSWSTIALQGTDDALDITPLEPAIRRAAAGARILLCMAAGERLNASWEACTTESGFVVRGNDKLRFGELAEEAAAFSLPKTIALRTGKRAFLGERLPRLDVPAKLDGSLTFAGDIRLPDMVHASIRMGGTLDAHDAKAAAAVAGFAGLVEGVGWLGAAAQSWWAADQALQAARPRFSNVFADASDKSVRAALDAALAEGGTRVLEQGDPDERLTDKPFERTYHARFAPHAALEPLAATAALDDDRLQLWIATQVPDAARAAAARGAGIAAEDVIVHVQPGGGSFGRRYEVEIAAQVAQMAKQLNRPVQLQWPRSEDMAHDRLRPAASARIAALKGPGGRLDALRVSIATTDPVDEVIARNEGASPEDAQSASNGTAQRRAVYAGMMPYAISTWAIDHHAADLGFPSGRLRGGPDGFSCFFVESFIDEAARGSGLDPFSIRMGMLSGNPRLALCLSRVTTRGGWVGGAQGSGQGLACYSTGDSHIAVLAEARLDETQRVRVSKLVAVADVGRMVNPEIALQQVEGSLLHGLALATLSPTTLAKGVIQPQRLGALNWPRLADMPDISLEIVSSSEPSGQLGEFALPPVAPAIANAVASASGRRFRTLPLGIE